MYVQYIKNYSLDVKAWPQQRNTVEKTDNNSLLLDYQMF